ncbi:unnamed protein product [Adineta ricciae]|uniref:EF-hand domain-containing protein n=1 Tax=Adineta ricciae TaxID=249248 RepID=A0A814LUN3_ADIRI|nr:unnamed protein product [Adineta ricciae]CAF1666825.1 unnamed protein product [Adineta ricciae]
MPPKSGKIESNLIGSRSGKKQAVNKINDVTERTQQNVLERFTDEQLVEFRELFNMFDKDNQGFLTLQALVSTMKSVGQTPTEADTIDLMREIDIDNSGTIDFYEFVHIISRKMHPSETTQEIRQAFNLFDQNQDGMITLDDLQMTVEKYLKTSINDFDLPQMIELAADDNASGQISFEDFLRVAVCRTDKKRSDGTST